jgi:hypothetical protein
MKRLLLVTVFLCSLLTVAAQDFHFPRLSPVLTGSSYLSESPVEVQGKMFFTTQNGAATGLKDKYLLYCADFSSSNIELIPFNQPVLPLVNFNNEILVDVYNFEADETFCSTLNASGKKLRNLNIKFPYSPYYCEYFQNGVLFTSREVPGGEGAAFYRFIFNLNTGVESKNSALSAVPIDISPDKQFLLLSDDTLLLTDSMKVFTPHKTVVHWLGDISMLIGKISQSGFLSNGLLIAFTPNAANNDMDNRKRIFTIDGDYYTDVRFFFDSPGNRSEEIPICYFSEDLSRGLARTGNSVAIVDTTSFRDWLNQQNLLFRPTTAVSTESRVRIRENPNLEAQTFGHLERGDELEVTDRSGIKVKIGEMTDWWYRIRRKSDGLEGWAYGAFLKLASYQGELGLRPEKDLR